MLDMRVTWGKTVFFVFMSTVLVDAAVLSEYETAEKDGYAAFHLTDEQGTQIGYRRTERSVALAGAVIASATLTIDLLTKIVEGMLTDEAIVTGIQNNLKQNFSTPLLELRHGESESVLPRIIPAAMATMMTFRKKGGEVYGVSACYKYAIEGTPYHFFVYFNVPWSTTANLQIYKNEYAVQIIENLRTEKLRDYCENIAHDTDRVHKIDKQQAWHCYLKHGYRIDSSMTPGSKATLMIQVYHATGNYSECHKDAVTLPTSDISSAATLVNRQCYVIIVSLLFVFVASISLNKSIH